VENEGFELMANVDGVKCKISIGLIWAAPDVINRIPYGRIPYVSAI
jgi:hypothetical protein